MTLDVAVLRFAGFVVLLSVALAIFVHPWWIGLSAFIGAGLIFSGVTDTCGMAMLLGRMPWNQQRGAAACCSC